MWRIEIDATDETRTVFERALDTMAVAVSTRRTEAGWRLTGLTEERPNDGAATNVLAVAAAAAGVQAPSVALSPLVDQDWVARSLDGLGPVDVGRLRIRGGHVPRSGVPGKIDLVVEAGRAFGTGHHPTTKGCLLALNRLARRQDVLDPLDMGCGSGVLAMAIARLWHRPVFAVDIDPEAVAVTRENARDNGLGSLVRAARAGTFGRSPLVGRRFDLIVANILSRPLIDMSRGLSRALKPGAAVVLSGLLDQQAASVLIAYRRQGLRLEDRIPMDGWSTLILRRAWNRKM